MRRHVLNEIGLATEPYGSEAWWTEIEGPPPPAHCHDCAVPLGEYHTRGCDMERCPHDGSQALTCECQVAERGTLADA
jgi:hypothetical protein